MSAPLMRLEAVLAAVGRAAVAVSGGVDSLTLAHVVHQRLNGRSRMFHAVSPAVPALATRRVETLAHEGGWTLEIIEAGEFADADYIANPVDRCFHCKSCLYSAIGERWDGPILSGTNTDDLGDFRPGLEAARAAGVRHPYVEAGIDKAAVRTLAAGFGLAEVSELPASPCLSSRIETGIPIDGDVLGRIEQAERRIGEWLGRKGVTPEAVRCRMRRDGMVVELDPASLAAVDDGLGEALGRDLFPDGVRFEPYARGSAFLTEETR